MPCIGANNQAKVAVKVQSAKENQRQRINMPPLMSNVCPLIVPAASDAKNAVGMAIFFHIDHAAYRHRLSTLLMASTVMAPLTMRVSTRTRCSSGLNGDVVRPKQADQILGRADQEFQNCRYSGALEIDNTTLLCGLHGFGSGAAEKKLAFKVYDQAASQTSSSATCSMRRAILTKIPRQPKRSMVAPTGFHNFRSGEVKSEGKMAVALKARDCNFSSSQHLSNRPRRGCRNRK